MAQSNVAFLDLVACINNLLEQAKEQIKEEKNQEKLRPVVQLWTDETEAFFFESLPIQ